MDNYLFGRNCFSLVATDIWTHHYSFILRVFSLYCTLSYVLYSLVDVFQSKAELYLVVLHRFKTYRGEDRALFVHFGHLRPRCHLFRVATNLDSAQNMEKLQI